MSDASGTLPYSTSEGDSGPGLAACLIRIGQCHRLGAPGARLLELDPLSCLEVGRGDTDGEELLGQGRLRLSLDDPWLSGDHARITSYRSKGEAWYVLEDRGSTNGTRVNGRPVAQRHQLAHGDMVVTGQTFWRFVQAPLELTRARELAYSGGVIEPLSSVSPALLADLWRAIQVAQTDLSLLICGETGTGKEVLARELHRLSDRRGRLAVLNCPAIPEGLFESELFGHRKGAFTGAAEDKQGLVEEAVGGTLLLDEIGELPLAGQAKLLRLLQEHSFTRVGETSSRSIDVRFLAATNQDLEQMVQRGAFRADLYARLTGYTIELPPLRQRREDLGLLLAAVLGRIAGERAAQLRLSRKAYAALVAHDWPFNIRELEKTLGAAVALLAQGDEINLVHLPEALRHDAQGSAFAPPPPLSGRQGDEEQLRARLCEALALHEGNVSACARALGTSRVQVHRWIKRLELDVDAFRRG